MENFNLGLFAMQTLFIAGTAGAVILLCVLIRNLWFRFYENR